MRASTGTTKQGETNTHCRLYRAAERHDRHSRHNADPANRHSNRNPFGFLARGRTDAKSLVRIGPFNEPICPHLGSFRNHSAFHEQFTVAIGKRIDTSTRVEECR
jgi:hypothetical protein